MGSDGSPCDNGSGGRREVDPDSGAYQFGRRIGQGIRNFFSDALSIFSGPSGPSPQQIEQQRRAAEQAAKQRRAAAEQAAKQRQAGVLHDQASNLIKQHRYDEGIAAYKQVLELNPRDSNGHWGIGWAYWESGRYEDALPYYQKAVQFGCEVCRSDLAKLQAYLGEKRNKEALNKRMEDFATQVLDDTRRQSLRSGGAKPGAKDLDFLGQNNAFGIPEGVRPKDSGITPLPGPAPSVESKNAREQLANLARDSQIAERARSIEEAKYSAACGVDADACHKGDAVFAPTIGGKAPVRALELAALIPDKAKDDKKVRENFGWFQSLEGLRIDAEQQSAEIRQQLKGAATGNDKAVLEAKLATVNQQLQRIVKDQDQAKEQIKKRLLDLSLGWNEGPKEVAPRPKGTQQSPPNQM